MRVHAEVCFECRRAFPVGLSANAVTAKTVHLAAKGVPHVHPQLTPLVLQQLLSKLLMARVQLRRLLAPLL